MIDRNIRLRLFIFIVIYLLLVFAITSYAFRFKLIIMCYYVCIIINVMYVRCTRSIEMMQLKLSVFQSKYHSTQIVENLEKRSRHLIVILEWNFLFRRKYGMYIRILSTFSPKIIIINDIIDEQCSRRYRFRNIYATTRSHITRWLFCFILFRLLTTLIYPLFNSFRLLSSVYNLLLFFLRVNKLICVYFVCIYIYILNKTKINTLNCIFFLRSAVDYNIEGRFWQFNKRIFFMFSRATESPSPIYNTRWESVSDICPKRYCLRWCVTNLSKTKKKLRKTRAERTVLSLNRKQSTDTLLDDVVEETNLCSYDERPRWVVSRITIVLCFPFHVYLFSRKRNTRRSVSMSTHTHICMYFNIDFFFFWEEKRKSYFICIVFGEKKTTNNDNRRT